MSQADVGYARESIRAGSKSFALAARLFSAAMRDDVIRLYAWCRHCDDVIDGQIDGYVQNTADMAAPETRIAQLRDDTARALDGADDLDAVFAGLGHVVRAHAIDPAHPFALLSGFEMDVQKRAYDTVDETLDYAYHVAGVVGVMMANIMGVRDEATLDRASDLGLAFQLTNIVRDIYEDAAGGRVYLPRALLRAHHAPTTAAAIADAGADADDAVHGAACALLDIAELYYASAEAGVDRLPLRARMAIRAAARIYREIGEEIRRRPPAALRARTYTSALTKSRLAAGAVWAAFSRTEDAAPAQRQAHLYARPVTQARAPTPARRAASGV